MRFDRRSFLKLLLATAVAEAVDVEQLLWVPKPIITVPAFNNPNMGTIVAAAWEKYVKLGVEDNIFSLYLLESLKEH